jgi:hypothetical protein
MDSEGWSKGWKRGAGKKRRLTASRHRRGRAAVVHGSAARVSVVDDLVAPTCDRVASRQVYRVPAQQPCAAPAEWKSKKSSCERHAPLRAVGGGTDPTDRDPSPVALDVWRSTIVDAQDQQSLNGFDRLEAFDEGGAELVVHNGLER